MLPVPKELVQTMSRTERFPAIEATDLRKRYPGDVQALDGVTFTVPEGTIYALLGPNGAGKTTTVRILTTLSRADGGSARVAGTDVARDPSRVRREIGVVAQRSGVDPNATGRENLLLQGRLFGLSGRDLASRVDELLGVLGLTEDANRLASAYSGGMARRLDIGLGLVHRPRVLFLDEPTTGLDPEVRVALWSEVARLAREGGLTVLLTTHYLEEADRLADRLAILDRGRLVTEGTPEGLKASLHGDAIAVELANGTSEQAVRDALYGHVSPADIQVEGHVVHLRVATGPTALPAVLSALDSRGVPVAAATISRPSLDDVYLRHTGRSFAAADRSASKEAHR
jgi:ABC-2 type transport system ATP-binding protein